MCLWILNWTFYSKDLTIFLLLCFFLLNSSFLLLLDAISCLCYLFQSLLFSKLAWDIYFFVANMLLILILHLPHYSLRIIASILFEFNVFFSIAFAYSITCLCCFWGSWYYFFLSFQHSVQCKVHVFTIVELISLLKLLSSQSLHHTFTT